MTLLYIASKCTDVNHVICRNYTVSIQTRNKIIYSDESVAFLIYSIIHVQFDSLI
jgi:hypothetical protein